MTTLKELRLRFRRKDLAQRHSPTRIAKWLDGVFDYSQVKFGKKGQGDIVIINLESPNSQGIHIEDYLPYTLLIDRIERTGIYTNVYFTREFFTEVTKSIIDKTIER